MHYPYQGRQSYSEQSRVKVAVLADSLSQEDSSQKIFQDLLLASTIASLAVVAFLLIH